MGRGSPDAEPADDAAITPDELAQAVRRATEAGIPVAVAELRGPGSPFEPSRGATGAWYQPDEIALRKLTLADSDVLDKGIALYPPPGDDSHSVIVVPLAHGNWLVHSEERERAVIDAAGDAPPAQE